MSFAFQCLWVARWAGSHPREARVLSLSLLVVEELCASVQMQMMFNVEARAPVPKCMSSNFFVFPWSLKFLRRRRLARQRNIVGSRNRHCTFSLTSSL
jgi:hypothetical protein